MFSLGKKVLRTLFVEGSFKVNDCIEQMNNHIINLNFTILLLSANFGLAWTVFTLSLKVDLGTLQCKSNTIHSQTEAQVLAQERGDSECGKTLPSRPKKTFSN